MASKHSGVEPALRNYVIGFSLALLLTAIAFGLVAFELLPRSATLIAIFAAAVVQILVHLRYFLHLDFTETPRENLFAIVFAAVLILIMIGGSLWIMFDLNARMVL